MLAPFASPAALTIVRSTIRVTGIEEELFFGRCRTADVVQAREVAVLALRERGHSFPEIARAMGRPNHSTVACMAARANHDALGPLVDRVLGLEPTPDYGTPTGGGNGTVDGSKGTQNVAKVQNLDAVVECPCCAGQGRLTLKALASVMRIRLTRSGARFVEQASKIPAVPFKATCAKGPAAAAAWARGDDLKPRANGQGLTKPETPARVSPE